MKKQLEELDALIGLLEEGIENEEFGRALRVAGGGVAVRDNETPMPFARAFKDHVVALRSTFEALAGAAVRPQLDYVELLLEAQKRVRESCLWKRFIDGTPLENDIAVWMTDFAVQVAKLPPGDPVCEHGTALDVHCCNCHSGFIFDADHDWPAVREGRDPQEGQKPLRVFQVEAPSVGYPEGRWIVIGTFGPDGEYGRGVAEFYTEREAEQYVALLASPPAQAPKP